MQILKINETPEKQNTLCQCRKNANFECHHCKTAARMQRPIRFAMDPQRECDFFLTAKRLKSRNYRQPLQNASENANFKNQRTRLKNRTPFVSAEKMRILSATTAKLQRECKDPSVLLWIRSENAIFFCQRNDWKAEIIGNPCKTPARMQILKINETPEKQNTLCQCRKNANFECHHCQTAARMQRPIRFAMDPQRECDFFLPANAIFQRQRNAWKA